MSGGPEDLFLDLMPLQERLSSSNAPRLGGIIISYDFYHL